MKKLTQTEFINKCIKKYGDKYDYSKVNYTNNKEKIIVICKEHGDFLVRADCHLNGSGCPICGGTNKKNTKDFITRANIVHNNYFSYDKCEYKSSSERVIVTCPVHGDFEVKANNHINGANCKKCYLEGITHTITKLNSFKKSSKTYDTKTFIEKCRLKWGEIYSYDNTIYKKNNKHVVITCKEHGDFLITPNHFLSGRGCPKCSKNYKYTNDEFIDLLKEKFGSKYIYDNVKYRGTHVPIIIGCVKHGNWNIQPSNLLKGRGCPSCNQSKMEEDLKNFFDEHGITYIWQYNNKIFNGLSIDFFLPDKNICIECQGIQHFEPVDAFGGIEAFTKQKERDSKKLKICNENNMHMLYYADYDYNFDYDVINTKEKLLTKILEY